MMKPPVLAIFSKRLEVSLCWLYCGSVRRLTFVEDKHKNRLHRVILDCSLCYLYCTKSMGMALNYILSLLRVKPSVSLCHSSNDLNHYPATQQSLVALPLLFNAFILTRQNHARIILFRHRACDDISLKSDCRNLP